MSSFNNYEGKNRTYMKQDGYNHVQRYKKNNNNNNFDNDKRNKYFNQNKLNNNKNNYYNKYNQNDASKIIKNIIPDKFRDSFDHSNDNDYLDNIQIKQQLIEYLYSTIELSNYKYKLIEFEYDLPLLKEKQYYASPNYNGIHSLLVFKKIKDKYLSFLIDRKTLTYNINQIDYDKVKIIPIYVHFDESIYNGSIIDGVLLYNNINGLKNFVINDIYYFRGNDMSSDKITNKMLHITTYLEKINNDVETNNIIFIVNKLYYLSEIQQLVNTYIPKSKYNKSIKGLSFYSEYSGTKLIYLYNNCSHEKTEDSPEIEIIKPNIKTPKENIDNIIRKPNVIIFDDSLVITCKMKKTDTIDVYNLYLGQKFIENNKKLFRYKKIGIAYIPTKECSFFCKDIFNKTDKDSVLMDCKYDSEKERWIPFKLILNKKRPDLVEKIENIVDN